MKTDVRKRLQVAKTKTRIKAKIKKSGKFRLAFFRGNKNFYAQIIDDVKGITLVAAATNEKGFAESREKNLANIDSAVKLGKILAERAKEKSITTVVFDRAGKLYHGKVKAFADSVRENGIEI